MRCPHNHLIPTGKPYCPTCNKLAVARYRARRKQQHVQHGERRYVHGPTWQLLIALGYVGRRKPARVTYNSLGLEYRGP